MPVARNVGHRLRAGTWTSAQLTTTYLLTSFPVQADQTNIPWSAPNLLKSKIAFPKPDRIVSYQDRSRRSDGYYELDWFFDYWTLGMYQYFITTFWPSNIWFAPITLMTYDEGDNQFFMQGNMARPEPNVDYQMMVGGYTDIVLHFTKGVTGI